jgi:hypothetical protein
MNMSQFRGAEERMGDGSESSVPVSPIAMGNEGHRDGELIHSGDINDTDVIVYATPSTDLHCCRTATRAGLRSHQSQNYYSALLVLNILQLWISNQLFFRHHWLKLRESDQLAILNTMFSS